MTGHLSRTIFRCTGISVPCAGGILALVVGLPHYCLCADWPMYRGDAARSGFTSDAAGGDQERVWVYESHSPRPAWPRLARMDFDRAFQPVVAGGRLFFGSSADDTVYALNAANGRLLWSFTTDGPIRFAPAVAGGAVFAGSDDGYLYSLNAADGSLRWKYRAGPTGEMVLGNERLISRWPLRGGPACRDGVVYFAAGIWPSEGIYVGALRASTGEEIWVNRNSGSLYMGQPHGGANAASGVAAQGYLVVTDTHVLVPTGRAVPAAFQRKDGKFLYYHLQKNGHTGGTATMARGGLFFNGGVVFDTKSGGARGKLGKRVVAGTAGGLLAVGARSLKRLKLTTVERRDRRGRASRAPALAEVRSFAGDWSSDAVIVTGERAVLGGDGRVTVVDLQSGRAVASHAVAGVARGLAFAAGRLYVSTDRGSIYAYGSAVGNEVREIPEPERASYGSNDHQRKAAAAIIAKTGMTAKSGGVCVDLGCGDGALAYELARRTRLQVLALDPDKDNVASARDRLQAAGLYGHRVTVLQRRLDATGLPAYIADLVVSSRCLDGSTLSAQVGAEAKRIQRPYGGIVCVGAADHLRLDRRGPPAGAGQWSHQYANPANTACSGDAIKGPLRPLWFRGVAQDLVQRHGRPPAPLFLNGRVFSLGLDSLICVDAYNGRLLWKRSFPGILRGYQGDHLMGTAGTHGNYCVDESGVYVRAGRRCVRVDVATGDKLDELTAPLRRDGESAPWGYIAYEGGVVFGTLVDPEHVVTYRYLKGGDLAKQLTESTTLFALDATSGELRWRFDAEHSIRHNAIAIGGGWVFLIDRPQAKFDRVKNAPAREHPTGTLHALDAATGEERWKSSENIYGTTLALSVEHAALLMSYQPTRFRLASELGGRMTVFGCATGKRLWERKVRYSSRPLINGSTIYAEGGAWDVLEGTERPFDFARSYGCGVLAGGKNLMVFRSATLAYFDLSKNDKVRNFGGLRPGCWINAVPAGGVVVVPDGSTGCACSYQNKTWMALKGADEPTKLRGSPAGSRRR